jgi:hypothetical protein
LPSGIICILPSSGKLSNADSLPLKAGHHKDEVSRRPRTVLWASAPIIGLDAFEQVLRQPHGLCIKLVKYGSCSGIRSLSALWPIFLMMRHILNTEKLVDMIPFLEVVIALITRY